MISTSGKKSTGDSNSEKPACADVHVTAPYFPRLASSFTTHSPIVPFPKECQDIPEALLIQDVVKIILIPPSEHPPFSEHLSPVAIVLWQVFVTATSVKKCSKAGWQPGFERNY